MIPIFIITYDRLEVLKQSIQSYRDNIKTSFEIVIIDFGSTYEPTIKYLKKLEQEKVFVYWQEKIIHRFRFNKHVGDPIRYYFTTHPKSNYVVTDPDIALDNVEGDILDVYAHILETLPAINIVGTMLRIDDIPDHYPRKSEAIEHEMRHNPPNVEVANIQYKNRDIQYIHCRIDTTFGMHRAENHFNRLRSAVRVQPPYAARHLDWYLDPENLTPDQKYYMEHASVGITHWSRWE